MGTHDRKNHRHARGEKRGRQNVRPERHERPERPDRPDRRGKAGMPDMGRALGIVTILFGAMYALATAALVCLPVAYSWQSISMTVTVASIAGGPEPVGSFTEDSPFARLMDYLETKGFAPKRAPWKPSGVDYGNTSMLAAAQGNRVYMAWQYNPATLKAVPPGVNVLAPRWFYVEDDGGKAVVNDLGHLIKGKVSSWNPVQYVNAAHAGGAKVWAEVFTSTPRLSKQIVTDADRRNEFISRIAGWVQQYRLDGIDFDFEDMDPADADQYTALIALVRQALPAGAAVCVDVTVPLDKPDPGNWWQCYDREGLGQAADYVAVMAYDTFNLKPTAAIDWVDGRVKALLNSVPAEKILLGVPFYGTDFMANAPQGEKLTEVPADMKAKSSRNIFPSSVQSLLDGGFYTSGSKKTTVDYWIDRGTWSGETATTEYAFVDTDGLVHVLFCEDERSLLAKGALTAFDRLGGVAVWQMSYGTDPMWKALLEGMTGAE